MKRPYHVKLLLREIEKRKEKNQRYSLRAFASFLDVAPSTLSRILSNSQELSIAGTKNIIKKLQLSEEEKFLFIASVAEEKRLRTLQTIEKFPCAIGDDFRFTLESIVELAIRRFCDGCIIQLTGMKDGCILHAKHRYLEFDLSSAPVICRPILNPEGPMFLHQEHESVDILKYLNAHSLLSVPVKNGDQKYGAISFLRLRAKEKFCEEDLYLAEELSTKAAFVYQLMMET